MKGDATLSVFLRGKLVGSLERTGPSRYRFAYSADVIQGDLSDPMARLSASLPLREERFKPGESAPFFEGLLPEGAVRATIAGKLGLSEANGFGMLAALGSDCAGAVWFYPRINPLVGQGLQLVPSAKARSASCSATSRAIRSASTSTPRGCA
jgi:HipA-like protein